MNSIRLFLPILNNQPNHEFDYYLSNPIDQFFERTIQGQTIFYIATRFSLDLFLLFHQLILFLDFAREIDKKKYFDVFFEFLCVLNYSSIIYFFFTLYFTLSFSFIVFFFFSSDEYKTPAQSLFFHGPKK